MKLFILSDNFRFVFIWYLICMFFVSCVPDSKNQSGGNIIKKELKLQLVVYKGDKIKNQHVFQDWLTLLKPSIRAEICPDFILFPANFNFEESYTIKIINLSDTNDIVLNGRRRTGTGIVSRYENIYFLGNPSIEDQMEKMKESISEIDLDNIEINHNIDSTNLSTKLKEFLKKYNRKTVHFYTSNYEWDIENVKINNKEYLFFNNLEDLTDNIYSIACKNDTSTQFVVLNYTPEYQHKAIGNISNLEFSRYNRKISWEAPENLILDHPIFYHYKLTHNNQVVIEDTCQINELDITSIWNNRAFNNGDTLTFFAFATCEHKIQSPIKRIVITIRRIPPLPRPAKIHFDSIEYKMSWSPVENSTGYRYQLLSEDRVVRDSRIMDTIFEFDKDLVKRLIQSDEFKIKVSAYNSETSSGFQDETYKINRCQNLRPIDIKLSEDGKYFFWTKENPYEKYWVEINSGIETYVSEEVIETMFLIEPEKNLSLDEKKLYSGVVYTFKIYRICFDNQSQISNIRFKSDKNGKCSLCN